jgi:probable phosphoglycerate mutase
MSLPLLYVVRHGDTDWTVSHQHTGRTDLPLNEKGEEHARELARRLKGVQVAGVFTSPLQRAFRTCQLAGFAASAVTDADLVEWDYGDYEGKTTAEIRAAAPNWELFSDGCPGGESIDDVAARADRFIFRVRHLHADAMVFSSGHFLRVLAARWVGLPPQAGRCLFLGTATVGILGYEHGPTEPVIRLWNDDGRLTALGVS